VLSALLIFGQRLCAVVHLVAQQKSSELFMLNVLLFTLGWHGSPNWPGSHGWARLSPDADLRNEYRYQVRDIKPFRDVLLGLFFVHCMLLDPGSVIAGFGWVVLLCLSCCVQAAVVACWRAGSPESGDGIRSASAGAGGRVRFRAVALAAVNCCTEVMQNVLAAMLLSMLIALS